jgi:hypothetical protein
MNTADRKNIEAQRKRAVKTAWMLAAVAFLIFVAFIMSGVLES